MSLSLEAERLFMHMSEAERSEALRIVLQAEADIAKISKKSSRTRFWFDLGGYEQDGRFHKRIFHMYEEKGSTWSGCYSVTKIFRGGDGGSSEVTEEKKYQGKDMPDVLEQFLTDFRHRFFTTKTDEEFREYVDDVLRKLEQDVIPEDVLRCRDTKEYLEERKKMSEIQKLEFAFRSEEDRLKGYLTTIQATQARIDKLRRALAELKADL